jgi:hypothetical protein
MKFKPCDFRITLKNQKPEKDDKEIFNDEDKLELFKEFIKEHHQEPEKNDVIHNFKIDLFYQKLKLNCAQYHVLADLLQETL